MLGEAGVCVGYRTLRSSECATHPRWGLCSACHPQGPQGRLGLAEVSQGTLAQPICAALRLNSIMPGVELEALGA